MGTARSLAWLEWHIFSNNSRQAFDSCSHLSFGTPAHLPGVAVLHSLQSILIFTLAIHCSSPPLFHSFVLVLYYPFFFFFTLSTFWPTVDGGTCETPISRPLIQDLTHPALCSGKTWPTYTPTKSLTPEVYLGLMASTLWTSPSLSVRAWGSSSLHKDFFQIDLLHFALTSMYPILTLPVLFLKYKLFKKFTCF